MPCVIFDIFGSEMYKLSPLLSDHWTSPVIALIEWNVEEPPATNILAPSSERAPAALSAAINNISRTRKIEMLRKGESGL